MKIGIVVPGFAADADDWCIPALTNLVAALAARPGLQVHVYTLRYPARRANYRLRGATVHAQGGATVGGRRLRGAGAGWLWTRLLATLRREHRRAPFTLLHGFWATESGYLTALAGRLLGVPTLIHLAGGELTYDRASDYGNAQPGLARLLVALSLRLATGITVPSGPMAAQLRAHYSRYVGKARPWAFGVDLARFAPPASPAGPATPGLRLIQAASLVPVKGQAALIDALAAAQAARPDLPVYLTLAGEGPLEAALRQQAATRGVAARVTFAGQVRHEALPALYARHDGFILTSRHEAQCMAVLEAAAVGLPWIGPPVGALADLAPRRPASGWLAPTTQAEPLAAAILAAADPAARAARGATARAAVAESYALETQTTRLLALYARVLSSEF